jgi:4-amino-4-deoxy-L-arabinose transferase-like glycosyltransferase
MFMDSSIRRNYSLQLLLALVFLSRLLAAIGILAVDGPAGFCTPDTGSYFDPAASLLHVSFSARGTAEIFRTPGYPLLLVPAVVSRHPVLVAVFENLLLATLSTWLIWQIAEEVAPASGAAVWAVLLYCFEPLGLVYSEKLLSDLLFSTQLLLCIWLILVYLRNPTWSRLLAAGLALSAATYTRPVSLFLGLWLIPFFLFFPRGLSWTARIPRTASFVLVFILTLVPWVLRNQKVADYKGFAAIGEYNLYFYSAAAVQAHVEHKSFSQAQKDLGFNDDDAYFRLHPEQKDWSEGRIFQYKGLEARRVISQHWLVYSLIHLRGCVVVMFDPALTEIMKLLHRYPENGGLLSRGVDQGVFRAALWLVRQYPETALTLPLLELLLFFYYLAGLYGLRHLRLESAALFVFMCSYLILVAGSSGALARYRMPVMPLLCVSAGAAMANLRKRGEATIPAALEVS